MFEFWGHNTLHFYLVGVLRLAKFRRVFIRSSDATIMEIRFPLAASISKLCIGTAKLKLLGSVPSEKLIRTVFGHSDGSVRRSHHEI